MNKSIYDFSVTANRGETVSLSQYLGGVLLIVNTASQCRFTGQYAGLERLYRDLNDKGFEILAFPCNQFGRQEPGADGDIADFCQRHFQVSFPLFAKIAVNGKDAHPLYTFLKNRAPGILGSKSIKWNFTKFLVGRNGHIVQRFAPQTTPESLRQKIETIL